MRHSTRPKDTRPAGQAGAVRARQVSRVRLGASEKVSYGVRVAQHVEDPGNRTPFAVLIRKARLSKSWTQEDLADVSGVSRSTLIRWESGEVTEPEAKQVLAAADALGVPRTDIFQALGWIPAADDQVDPVTAELLELREAVASVLRLVDEQLKRQDDNQRQE